MVDKKLIGIFISAALLFSVFSGVVSAQTDELPDPGLLPGNPFYFLKIWFEAAGTFLTFNDVAKAERLVNLSEKRLAEAKALIDRDNAESAEKALSRYEEQLEAALKLAQEAGAKGLNTDDVLAKVTEATLKHQSVLADVYLRVPEQAQAAIQRAMEAGIKGHEQALKSLSEVKQKQIRKRVQTRLEKAEKKLQALKGKGLPVPTIPAQETLDELWNEMESSLEGVKPTIEAAEVTIEAIQPTVEAIKPTIEAAQETIEKIRPTVESLVPTVGINRP